MVKEVTVICPQEGADKGKQFLIKRMSAVDADRWGRHCLQAAARSGGDIMGVTEGGGLAAVAAAGIGIFAAMEPERMDQLIDRLMQQVWFIPDPTNPGTVLPFSVAAQSQIEEIPTVGWLQGEAFKLHLDFFKGVGHLFSLLSLMLQAGNSDPTPELPTSASGQD